MKLRLGLHLMGIIGIALTLDLAYAGADVNLGMSPRKPAVEQEETRSLPLVNPDPGANSQPRSQGHNGLVIRI